ncbi:acyl-CoA dehydrogenase family protein [Xanthobacter sp. V3C-3]|uniref:acyl-CoA dehydrogenase family protein n=1 Tax=Xanthobacter lutulentifluminis TaxID=3119935 RepID=UPI00372CDE1B
MPVTALSPHDPSVSETDAGSVLAQIGKIAVTDLSAWARAIDEGTYPATLLHRFADAGAFRLHLPGGPGLGAAIEGMSRISEVCTATAFMAWCQNTLVWYLISSDNAAAKAKYLAAAATGHVLGGTALSNPMKSFFGIETLKLKGTRVEGGYRVKGILPWVSNLGPDHFFGAIFALEGREGEPVMALIDCADPAVTLKPCEPFLGMDGTGTYAVQVRDLFVPDEMVLAHEAMPFVKKMRAGFILLQAGMAVGLMRDAIAMMREVEGPLGHVNRYLETQPDAMAETLAGIEAEVNALAATPDDASPEYWRRVVAARLVAGEKSVEAAHNAMLHCGARGYVRAHRCQRRLREAYFVAIVTPATKQLKLMLDQMGA